MSAKENRAVKLFQTARTDGTVVIDRGRVQFRGDSGASLEPFS